jgi:ABC-type lipoprotein release transport system permease subunit
LIPDSAIQQAQTLLEIDGVSVAKFVTKLDTMDVQNLQLFEYDNQDEDFDITTYQNENQNDFVHYMTRIIMN